MSRPIGALCRSALSLALGIATTLASCGGGRAGPRAPQIQAAAELVDVRLIAFNDFHGNLEPPGGDSGTVLLGRDAAGQAKTVLAGGAAYLAAHVAALRASHPNTVVVAAGDLVGASPLLSARFHDEPTIEAMGLIGLDASAIGNHELDEGRAEILRLQSGGCHPQDGCLDGTGFAGARFEYLAANVRVRANGETLFPRSMIRELSGIPVAFIGMTLEGTPGVVSPEGVAGLEFADEADTVNAMIPELTAAGVRAIVVLIHEGGLQAGLYDACEGISGAIVDIAKRLDPAVDVIVSGHTHEAYNCEIAGKRVTSALSFGRLLTTIDLRLDPKTHDVVSILAENHVVTRDVAPDPGVSALVDRYSRIIAPYRDRVVGLAAEDLLAPRSLEGANPAGESTLGDLIADSQLDATASATTGAARIAFMNPGGIRADLDAGPVTFGDLFTVQPFENKLVSLSLTGEQIHRILEQQFASAPPRILQVSNGFRYAWSASAPVGRKVDPKGITLDGKPLEAKARYRVTVNSFLASGGDGFTELAAGTDVHVGKKDVAAFEDYVAAHRPLVAPARDRIRRLP